MLTDLNDIVARKSKPTLNKKIATDMLLDYAHTHPSSKIRYHARNMILYVRLDANYLVMPGDCSCISRHYYLSENPTNPTNPSYVYTNGIVINECKTLQHLFGSTS